MEVMCLCKERSDSKVTPKFLADKEGEIVSPEVERSVEVILER